jgi:uncharacterized protein YbcI
MDVSPTRRSPLLELSNEMVRLYKHLFGRGPTKTRCDYAGRDAILCTLEDSLTPAERSLAALGEHQRLRDTRMFFQYASREEFVSATERITGRRVRAFVSGIDTEQDVSTELFYFDPLPDDAGDGKGTGTVTAGSDTR